METIAIIMCVLITAATFFLFAWLTVNQTIIFRSQKYFLWHSAVKLNIMDSSALPACELSTLESTKLQWGEINFFDKEYGFPVMQMMIFNTGNETVTIERAKFNITAAGRLQNRVEGHGSLYIAPWSYTVQFDPLFEGNGTVVDIATDIPPHSSIQLSFTIGHETSDVETPTLYHFHVQLEPSNSRKCISMPLTIAIPSPVRAKSYAMLEERGNVIEQNTEIVRTFSAFTGVCNPLARQILHHQPVWLPTKHQHYGS